MHPCGLSAWKIIITNQCPLLSCNLASVLSGQQSYLCSSNGHTAQQKNYKNIHFILSIVFTYLSIFLIEVEWKGFVYQAFANYTKLPIIQMVMFQILGFYGYDDKEEQAANLLFLARIQSPLIKSLSSL